MARKNMLRLMLIEVIVAVAIISVHPWVELRGLVRKQID